MQSVYNIIINYIFNIIGKYKCGVINNRPVINENLIGNQNNKNINNTNPTIQVYNG